MKVFDHLFIWRVLGIGGGQLNSSSLFILYNGASVCFVFALFFSPIEAPGKGEIVSRVFDFRSFHFFCSLSHLFCCVYAIFSRAGLIEEQNSAVRFE